jgi:hypothetical protein
VNQDDWQPVLELAAEKVRFKWGLNHETGEVAIWEVGGPGDGLPTHGDHLRDLWGREPRLTHDVIGNVSGSSTALTVVAYYDASVPDALLAVLQTQFPDATVITDKSGTA